MAKNDQTNTRPKFRTNYSPAVKITMDFKLPSRTKQSMSKDCDINQILKQYKQTGQLPDLIKTNPQYGDFSSPLDYQESLNQVLLAQEQFAALPSHVRSRFANDPVQFLAFATNEANAEELIRLGLATKRNIDDPQASEPAPKTKPAKGAAPPQPDPVSDKA